MITLIIIISIVILLFRGFPNTIQSIVDCIKESSCKHEKYIEKRDCYAYCTKCDKKMGFIGDIRKEKPKDELPTFYR